MNERETLALEAFEEISRVENAIKSDAQRVDICMRIARKTIAALTASSETASSGTAEQPQKVEEVARWLHETYEQEAVMNGWQTQPLTRVDFDDLPKANRDTMIALASRTMGQANMPVIGLVNALETLSKLGNGNKPGNSEGNRIAQHALEQYQMTAPRTSLNADVAKALNMADGFISQYEAEMKIEFITNTRKAILYAIDRLAEQIPEPNRAVVSRDSGEVTTMISAIVYKVLYDDNETTALPGLIKRDIGKRIAAQVFELLHRIGRDKILNLITEHTREEMSDDELADAIYALQLAPQPTAEIETLIDRLNEFVDNYAVHAKDCASRNHGIYNDETFYPDCDCGFDEALSDIAHLQEAKHGQ